MVGKDLLGCRAAQPILAADEKQVARHVYPA
jgi:hypothetical protein